MKEQETKGMTLAIPLTKGMFSIVDKSMVHALNFNWRASIRRDGKYCAKNSDTYLHHFVIGHPLNGLVVDHINGNTLDNRLSNLRIVTVRQNGCNRIDQREGKTSSRYPGVYWNKQKRKWQAQIKFGVRKKYLGRYDSQEEAFGAYEKALSAFYKLKAEVEGK